MKTLKIKRIQLYAMYYGLKKHGTSDFPTPDEMLKTYKEESGILASIEKCDETLSKMFVLSDSAQDIYKDFLRESTNKTEEEKEKLQKEYNDRLKVTNNEVNAIENAVGDEYVEVSFEDDVFNVFFSQFERWAIGVRTGRGEEKTPAWLIKPSQYIEAREAMNDTNKQPKSS